MIFGQRILLVLLVSLPMQVHASAFLGRSADETPSEKASAGFKQALLGELEAVLGSEHRTFTEKRLSKIEDVVRSVYRAMPKNEHGKLAHGGVSYILHRLFVQRHAWFIRGLAPGGKGDSAWNDTSPVALFTDRVPEYVQSVFEKRFGDSGMDVHEISVLAATLEHLVHKEALDRLQLAYKVHQFTPEDVVSTSEAPEILDTYMAVYILGFMLKSKTGATVNDVKMLRANVAAIYPTWPDTQQFVREVMDSLSPQRDYLYYSDVATVIEETGERYGRWQDMECRGLKETLLEVEDTGPGGAGRVRLADFYKLALHDGKWQFSESVNHLRDLGALDESNPENPRVIIANYINGPSNCVASSSYYAVCCIDECESLLAHLEQRLAKPDAYPHEIAAVVAELLAPTQQDKRTLSPWLLQQLDDVAAYHGGVVPLHGRLFSQWMHFAYPRECPYPHVAGTIDPPQLEDVAQLAADFTASPEEMQHHFESMPARVEAILNASAHEELTMLSMEEELVVWRPPVEPNAFLSMSLLLRGSAFVGAIVATTAGLVRSFQASADLVGQQGAQKYYV